MSNTGKKNYTSASERIVRVLNDEIHRMIDIVAKYNDVPYQWVFDVWCEMALEGNATNLNKLDKEVEKLVQREKSSE